jgi:hypothetical protein
VSSKYATFREHKGLVSVLMPLTEIEYMDVRKQLYDTKPVELYKKSKKYISVDIPSTQVGILATQESFYSEFTDREFLLESVMPEPIHGEWIYNRFDRKYNLVGYTDGIAKITQVFKREPIFNEALGRIGNPKHFMIIRITRGNINKLTPEGLKRMEYNRKKELAKE